MPQMRPDHAGTAETLRRRGKDRVATSSQTDTVTGKRMWVAWPARLAGPSGDHPGKRTTGVRAVRACRHGTSTVNENTWVDAPLGETRTARR
jgi:hypothetical protein